MNLFCSYLGLMSIYFLVIYKFKQVTCIHFLYRMITPKLYSGIQMFSTYKTQIHSMPTSPNVHQIPLLHTTSKTQVRNTGGP